MPEKILSTQQLLENPYLLHNDPKNEFYLYLRLKAAKVEPKGERAPINISVVLDRSGSMSGDKLEYVKKATDFIIKNLYSSDTLSIVQYDDVVDVVSKSGNVTDKDNLHKKVAGIVAGGMTNLSGGMMEGYNQTAITKRNGAVNRVLLLSDGLANVGITEPEALQRIAQQHFREKGLALSTFGVGEGFNELLMTNLAEYGGANYYFIATPDQIPQIFAKELSGLLAVVAQNTRVSVHFPTEYFACEKVYGYLHQNEEGGVMINFNDVFSEEEKVVTLKFRILKPLSNAQSFDFQVKWQYDDVVDTLGKQTETETLRLQVTSDKELVERNVNRIVLENTAQFIANDRFENVMKMSDKGEFEKAKNALAELVAYLETHLHLFPTSELLRKQYEQIKGYQVRLPELERMQSDDNVSYLMAQKMSRSVNYDMKKRK